MRRVCQYLHRNKRAAFLHRRKFYWRGRGGYESTCALFKNSRLWGWKRTLLLLREKVPSSPHSSWAISFSMQNKRVGMDAGWARAREPAGPQPFLPARISPQPAPSSPHQKIYPFLAKKNTNFQKYVPKINKKNLEKIWHLIFCILISPKNRRKAIFWQSIARKPALSPQARTQPDPQNPGPNPSLETILLLHGRKERRGRGKS